MDPNNQPPVTPQQPGQVQQSPATPNPYGFILDTQHQPKARMAVKTNSMMSRLLLVFGIGFGLLIVIVIGSKLLSGRSSGNVSLLTGIAAEQQEIIRVSTLGIASATDPTTIAFAQTTRLSLTSQQSKLTKYLTSKNVKVTPAVLATKLNKNTDTALKSASDGGRYDVTLMSTLKDSLKVYATDLKSGYTSATSTESKKILSQSYDSTQALLK